MGTSKVLHQVIIRDIVSDNPPIYKYQSKKIGIAPLLFYNPNFEAEFSKGLILRQLHFASNLEQEVRMAKDWKIYFDRRSNQFKGQQPIFDRPKDYEQDLVEIGST